MTKQVNRKCPNFKGQCRVGYKVPCSLFGLVVADLQRGVIVNKRHFQLIHSHPVYAALLAVQLDTVQVHHGGEQGQLHVALN